MRARLIEGTNFLAYITSKHPPVKPILLLFRELPAILNGEITDALRGI
jgi:hypothetical protein